MSSLAELLQAIDTPDYVPDTATLKELFKALRKAKVRRPDIVGKYGRRILKTCGDDVEGWAMMEFVLLSAFDIADESLIDACIQPLMRKFTQGNRVRVLIGQWSEYKGDYDAALKIYDEVLKDKPTYIAASKRKVCVYRAQKKWKDAIDQLNSILSVFHADSQSWLELADIYTTLCDYKSASVCYEEIVILNPNSPVFHTRLAEIYYTLGGLDDLIKSRQHYSISLDMLHAPFNLRALYGIIAACAALIDVNSASGGKRHAVSPDELSLTTAILEWARQSLEDICSRLSRDDSVRRVQAALQSASTAQQPVAPLVQSAGAQEEPPSPRT